METRYDVHSADNTAHDVYHTTSSLTLSSGTADTVSGYGPNKLTSAIGHLSNQDSFIGSIRTQHAVHTMYGISILLVVSVGAVC